LQDYDLIIVGAGSGNMLPTAEIDGWRIAVVESDRFGGTCLNRGCIPSKMLVYAADVAENVRRAPRYGIGADVTGVDWPAIRERVFSRIDPLHDRAVDYRRRHGIDVFLGRARFVAPKVLSVDGAELRGERIVLAVGSRPSVPDIPGLDSISYHTSDTIMRVAEPPRSMLVVGGGYIAAEMSHVFGAFGTQITIVQRGDTLLAAHDGDIRQRFTELYARRFDVRLATTVERLEPASGGVVARLRSRRGELADVFADSVLIATGRVPNSDQLDVSAGGLAVDEHGHIRTDDTYATSVPGVWALGDTTNHFQLKHMANAETRLVRHNLLRPDAPRRARFEIVPAAVFADPQVASVGATEDQLRREGRHYVAAVQEYGDTAYGWALEDTTSFVKVLADPVSRTLLGAHILGPQAATLIQPLIQAMHLGNTVDQLARDVLYIHPALTEVVENALLALPS
jgi:mycothione reductase